MLNFHKYQGTGNDFVILDNRNNNITLTTHQVAKLCDRKFGIGADGLMLLQQKQGYDFEMIYYNADGKLGSMCGNGGRCLTQFAFDIGIKKTEYHFIASDGNHTSIIDANNGWINLQMIDVNNVEKHNIDYVLNTGSPHYIKMVDNVKSYNVFKEGHTIRYSKDFVEKGINVNFVEIIGENDIFVRTYERGVEDETLSCGTGVTASALINYHNENGFNRVEVGTLGGRLAVEFDKIDETKYTNIWLCGPATFVFNGEIHI